MKLKDKVALVTGAASGIGEAIVKRFAEEGAKLLLVDLAEEKGQNVAAEITAQGAQAEFVHADVTQGQEVAAAVKAAEQHFGGLDILINNAGIAEPRETLAELSESMFERLFAVNVKSVYLGSHHALPLLRASGHGVIINTASTSGMKPRPGNAAYAASKAAVITFTRGLAQELAVDNIRVNSISPVATMTPLFLNFLGPGNEAKADELAALIPLKRLAESKDIAACAAFLASDEAAFLTGINIPVDGGWTAA